jgi:hypothetical protein
VSGRGVTDRSRRAVHSLGGAWHLRAQGFSESLVGLVAHHSGARSRPPNVGLDAELADALTAADQMTGPDGRPMDGETRLADMLRRHGPDSPQARVHHLRAPVVRAPVAETEHRLLAGRLADAFG